MHQLATMHEAPRARRGAAPAPLPEMEQALAEPAGGPAPAYCRR